MNPKPGSRRGWKILGGFLAILSAATGGLWLWIRSVETRQWAEMEARLRGLEQEAAARPGERPILRGDPLPGSAWEDYDRALKSMKEIGSVAPLADYLSRHPRADRNRILDLLKSQAPTLEAMRRGVRRADGARKIDWRLEAGRGNMSLQSLVSLAIAQAREGAAEGRGHEAAELLLDAVRVGEDLGTNSDLISALIADGLMLLSLDELKGIVLAGPLNESQLRQIAGELDALDRHAPRFGDILVNGATCAGWDMRHADSIGGYLKFYAALYPQGMPGVSAWRFAFSERMMMKDAFEKELDWSRRIARADARSWDDARRIIREVDAERAASTNGISRVVGRWLSGDGYYSLGASFRERRAQMRLLRAAALFRAGGDIPESDDPFDGKLIHHLKERRLKIWSVGRDAVDDGGSGEWNPRSGKDIVLEVER